MNENGRKFDIGKLEYGLLPPLALAETVKVLTFGAQKYERDNWQKVPDSKRRYFDAMQRHVWAWKQGEQIDEESGIHHLAHAMCCMMFLYEHDVKYTVDETETDCEMPKQNVKIRTLSMALDTGANTVYNEMSIL